MCQLGMLMPTVVCMYFNFLGLRYSYDVIVIEQNEKAVPVEDLKIGGGTNIEKVFFKKMLCFWYCQNQFSKKTTQKVDEFLP